MIVIRVRGLVRMGGAKLDEIQPAWSSLVCLGLQRLSGKLPCNVYKHRPPHFEETPLRGSGNS